MKQFKDKEKRDWTLEVNIGRIKAVRDIAGVDLYKLFATEAERLFSDPVLLVNVLYVLCKEQAATRKMSDEDFGSLFVGDVLEAAANALLEATVDFFPSSRQRILSATIQKSTELSDQMTTTTLEKINALTVTDLLRPTASLA